MIETGKDFNLRYEAAFTAAGGDPDSCDGVLWLRVVAASGLTADEIIEQIGLKIENGTANHGWLIGILRYLWDEWSEKQRLRIMELMGPRVVKCVLVRRNFDVDFTEAEKSLLAKCMQEINCLGAVKALNG